MTPREGHAALLAELRRRKRLCSASHAVTSGLVENAYLEHVEELRTLIQIAELHAPVNLDREPSHAHLTMCSVCYTENKNWPCRTIAPLLAACGIEVTR